jgi:hypothetical protein
MHQRHTADDIAAKGSAYGLVAEADTQDGDLARKMFDGRDGYTGFFR